jgi:hypothetical protein
MKLLILSVFLVFLMINQSQADCDLPAALLEQFGAATATKYSIAVPRKLLTTVDLKINPQLVGFGIFLKFNTIVSFTPQF